SPGILNMSGGSITLVNPEVNQNAGFADINFATGATVNMTGGTIYIGDGVDAHTNTLGFLIIDNAGTLNNLVVHGGGYGRQANMTTGFTTNSLTIANGCILSDSTKTLTVTGNVSNSGTTV